MVRTVLAALIALWVGSAQAQPAGGGQPIFCDKIDVNAALAAGTTQLIAGVAGQVINLCGYSIDENANGTIQLQFGTGATCTSATNLTSPITTLVNGLHINHLATAFASSLPGQSMCAIVTGTGSVTNIEVYYLQRP